MIWIALFGFVLTMIGYIQWVFTDYKVYVERPQLFLVWRVVFWAGIALMTVGCIGIVVVVHV